MVSLVIRLSLIATLLAALPGQGEAGGSIPLPDVEAGTLLRLSIWNAMTTEGEYLHSGRDTLFLAVSTGSKAFPWPDIRTIHARRGLAKWGFWGGAAVGGLAGGGFGALVRRLSEMEGGGNYAVIPIMAGIGGLIGGITGWSVGHAIPEWELVYRSRSGPPAARPTAVGGPVTAEPSQRPAHEEAGMKPSEHLVEPGQETGGVSRVPRRWLGEVWAAGPWVKDGVREDIGAVGGLFMGVHGYIRRAMTLGPEFCYYEFDEPISVPMLGDHDHYRVTCIDLNCRLYPNWGSFRPFVGAGIGWQFEARSHLWQSTLDSLWRESSSHDSYPALVGNIGLRWGPLLKRISLVVEGRWAGDADKIRHPALVGGLVVSW